MDVEHMVATRLMDATGIQAVIEVPDDRPKEFISVQLLGSTGDRFIKVHRLAVQSWAETRPRAAEIARMVELAAFDLDEEQNVFRSVANGTYRWPDPDSGQARYQTNLELTICE